MISTIVSTAVALLGATGLTQIIATFARRRATRAEVADRVNEMTLEWAAAVRADAEAARQEASSARTDAAEARRQMASLTAEIEMATARLRHWRSAIMDPTATLNGIRLLVSTGDSGSSNGASSS